MEVIYKMSLEELSMQLILAINEENLNNTINTVNLLNEMKLEMWEIYNLEQVLSLNAEGINYKNSIHNLCIDYVLQNLKHIPMYKFMLFDRKRIRMRQEQDLSKIENYIKELLNQENYSSQVRDIKDIIQTLIELSVLLKNREKTAYYFSLIQNKFFTNKEE